MKKIISTLVFLGFVVFTLKAQTATPNTTLCAAVVALNQNTVCLTSTTNVVDQTQLYIDQEVMTVVLSRNQTIVAAAVPVRRGSIGAGSGPQAHLNGSIVWEGLTPAYTTIPGVNGFDLGQTMKDIGPCTRTAQIYLPKIYPNLKMKRDCTTSGVWVDYAPASGLDNPSPTPISAIAVNSALSVSSGNYVLITKAGVIALTLTAPTAGIDDGKLITITADNGAYADTLTATALLQNGANGSPFTTATFGVTSTFVGGTITLKAYGGFWFVVAATGVALT